MDFKGKKTIKMTSQECTYQQSTYVYQWYYTYTKNTYVYRESTYTKRTYV